GEVRRTVQVGKRPRGILTTRDGRKIFVATSEDNSIVVLDPRTLEVLGRVPVDKDPKTFALDPLETRLFASNDDDNQLTVVDVESRQILKRIPIGKEAEGVSVSPDGRWVVSTSEAENIA